MATNERKAARDHILVDFQFYITEGAVKEGQSIAITKLTIRNAMRDFTGQQAKGIWIKRGRLYVEAGVKFDSDTRHKQDLRSAECLQINGPYLSDQFPPALSRQDFPQ